MSLLNSCNWQSPEAWDLHLADIAKQPFEPHYKKVADKKQPTEKQPISNDLQDEIFQEEHFKAFIWRKMTTTNESGYSLVLTDNHPHKAEFERYFEPIKAEREKKHQEHLLWMEEEKKRIIQEQIEFNQYK